MLTPYNGALMIDGDSSLHEHDAIKAAR